MITLREYLDGKADLAIASFGVPQTQRAWKRAESEKLTMQEKEKKEE